MFLSHILWARNKNDTKNILLQNKYGNLEIFNLISTFNKQHNNLQIIYIHFGQYFMYNCKSFIPVAHTDTLI